MRLLVFLGDEQADVAAVTEAFDERLVRDDVQFLDHFALDVDFAGFADNLEEPGAGDLRGDDFGGERDAREQPAKFGGGVGIAALALKEMTAPRF